MKIGIHEMKPGYLSRWSQKYIAILEYNNIEWELLSIDNLNFWERLKGCTHFIYHWGGSSDAYQKAHAMLPVIENELGIPCFPNWKISWHYDDKVKQYYLLKSHNFPVVDSYIFFNKQKAIDWIKNEAIFPLVFKLTCGASSVNTVLIKTKSHAIKIIKRMFGKGVLSGHIPGNDLWLKQFSVKIFFKKNIRALFRVFRGFDANQYYRIQKNYVLFQKFLPDNNYDSRVVIIGNRAFAFIRYNRKRDFRASGSRNCITDPTLIDINFVKIAHEISMKLKFPSMAYDFIYDTNHEPKITEISYTFPHQGVYSCPGYWDRDLNWHKGHYWPEYFQLVDFIGNSVLKYASI